MPGKYSSVLQDIIGSQSHKLSFQSGLQNAVFYPKVPVLGAQLSALCPSQGLHAVHRCCHTSLFLLACAISTPVIVLSISGRITHISSLHNRF